MVLKELHETIVKTVSNVLKETTLILFSVVINSHEIYNAKYRVFSNGKPIFILDIKTELDETIFYSENFNLLINLTHPNQVFNGEKNNTLTYGTIVAKIMRVVSFVLDKNNELKNILITNSELNNMSNFDIVWLKITKSEYYLIRIISTGFILSKFTKVFNNYSNGILTEDKTFEEKKVDSINELIKINELKPLIYNFKNYFWSCFI